MSFKKKLLHHFQHHGYEDSDFYLDDVVEIIENGANLEAKDEEGKTALFYACELGLVDIVEELIQVGANTEAKNKNKETILLYMLSECYDGIEIEIVDKLIKHGLNIHAKNKDGKTALSLALSKSCPDISASLITAGAKILKDDINFINSDGETNLHIACYNGNEKAVEVLLEAGIDISIKDKDGKTALDYAKNGKFENIVNKLQEKILDNNISKLDTETISI